MKLWVVFRLDDAVCGISNNGIDYDEYSFVLSCVQEGIFYTEEECEKYIQHTLEDYKKRGVGKGVRFIILPVFCNKDDKIFNR